MPKVNLIKNWKEMPKAKKVATVAGTVAAAGAVATTAVALVKGKKIQFDAFQKAGEEGAKFKLNIPKALGDGFKGIGADIVKGYNIVKEFVTSKFNRGDK